MKTRFSRRHSPLAPSATIALIAVVLLVLVITLVRFVFPSALSVLTAPLYTVGAFADAAIGSLEAARRSDAEHRALSAEVEALRNENRTLRAALADLGRFAPATGSVAGVTARPPVTPYDVLVVDRGTRDGVSVGNLARGAGGVPLGVVADANEASARIALYSAPGAQTPGWVGEARAPIMLRGEGSGAFSAEVPRESAVVEGDFVYVAAGGAHAIGVVARIVGEASSPSTELFIRPFASPFTTTWVTIDSL